MDVAALRRAVRDLSLVCTIAVRGRLIDGSINRRSAEIAARCGCAGGAEASRPRETTVRALDAAVREADQVARVVTRCITSQIGREGKLPKMSPSAIDWAAVRQRIRLVGAALELPATEVEEVVADLARGSEAKLYAFAERYGQSIHWIVTGDLAPMLRKLAGRISNQLPLPLEGEDDELSDH